MTYSELQFSTTGEFIAVMNRHNLNFVVFGAGPDWPDIFEFTLLDDEAAYVVDARRLNHECFGRFMRNCAVEWRVDPAAGLIRPVPQIRSYVGGEGFITNYDRSSTWDFQTFLSKSRAAKPSR